MARMREQNEKIKQRRADVQADEAAFKKTQEAEQQQRARIKKVQENVDRSREANAARKMAKVQNREWDADKRGGPKARGGGPQKDAPGSPAAEGASATPAEDTPGSPENAPSEASGADSDRWARGRGAPGGRARGGRGSSTLKATKVGGSVHAMVLDSSTKSRKILRQNSRENAQILKVLQTPLRVVIMLQNLIKRDPAAYKEEFLQQWNHYNSVRQIFDINPDEHAQHLRELVSFIAQVATCYPKETAEFPQQIAMLLLESYGSLAPEIRKTLVQNLVMLRNKGVITSIELLKTLFPLLPRTTSSTLRAFIRKTILADIRSANLRSKNHKLNRAVQAMLFGMVERGMDGEVLGDRGKLRAAAGPTAERSAHNGDEAMWAVVLTKELWKKGIWNDTKTVSIVALGCFHPVMKVQSASVHFFLGSDDEDEDSDDEDAIPDIKSLQHQREIKKKTRSIDRKLEKQAKKAKKKRQQKSNATSTNFPALQLLNDPQSFAEKLYDNLNRYDKRFSLEHKLLLMQLLSRVAGYHKLCVLGFYTYIVRYLTHKQLRVPAILVALAQSVHSLTPPDALLPVVRKIADEFVHPGVASEVIAAGLNSIREVCRRQPWAMEEDLLGDLVEYRKSRDKAVTAAARGVLQLYREVNPSMLQRRERGKTAAMGLAEGSQPLPFGHTADAAVDIEGLALLEDHLQKLRDEENGDVNTEDADAKAWEQWEVASDSDSDSDSDSSGWINVDSDNAEDIVVSDSEDEAEEAAAKTAAAAELEAAENRISTLATTKILTPADFALLADLRVQAATKAVEAGGGTKAKRKLAALEAAKKAATEVSTAEDTFVSENDILGPRKRAKQDYAERMESIQRGREGREKYGSLKGKKNKEAPSSSTNREKARNKPIMMIMSSGAVRGKKKASLRQKQQKLRAHIERGKKAYH
ncbi:SDA1-domain-containing protein [Schizophyllum commune H4-8]|uniref:Protein SDA1 n=1 Tax=Schizophyllum commune (strain H4-8 / FGSC 9210) TaxID=578458 RepID=D8PW85_SCHCM|nr:SDA1-domain-containing protein [Schizophyllum commune H4-8]KAI5900049.1 SDA1-domain-containing protein [Schizophyllum commune H4-8]